MDLNLLKREDLNLSKRRRSVGESRKRKAPSLYGSQRSEKRLLLKSKPISKKRKIRQKPKNY